jgi:hypothetical protein
MISPNDIKLGKLYVTTNPVSVWDGSDIPAVLPKGCLVMILEYNVHPGGLSCGLRLLTPTGTTVRIWMASTAFEFYFEEVVV